MSVCHLYYYQCIQTLDLIYFVGKPDPPIDPCVIVSRSHEMLLRWTPPSFDGGAPIIHYRIEKCHMANHIWSLACQTMQENCEIWVPKLQEGKTYSFRVFAVNKCGISLPSQSSPPHLCRALDCKL